MEIWRQMRTKATHPHAITELCEEGSRLYAKRCAPAASPRADVESAPCLMEFALLHPDPDDADCCARCHRRWPWRSGSIP